MDQTLMAAALEDSRNTGETIEKALKRITGRITPRSIRRAESSSDKRPRIALGREREPKLGRQ